MTTLREAAQRALEALEKVQRDGDAHWPITIDEAITALRDALAQEEQQEQEPVDAEAALRCALAQRDWAFKQLQAQPNRRESQELTKEDIAQNLKSRLDAAKLLEERRQEQQPVAWQSLHDKTDLYYRKPPQADVRPLYTHPPRREWQSLTTQEAMALTDTAPKGVFYGCDAGTGLGIWIAAVAAAEQALKEKNNG